MSADDGDVITWTLSRQEARDLLAYLRRNRPLGMPYSTLSSLVDALGQVPKFDLMAAPPEDYVGSPRHNHMTRDVKPEGDCEACDYGRAMSALADRVQPDAAFRRFDDNP